MWADKNWLKHTYSAIAISFLSIKIGFTTPIYWKITLLNIQFAIIATDDLNLYNTCKVYGITLAYSIVN